MAQKDPLLIKNFSGGWNSEFKSDNLKPSESPNLQNADFNASGSIKKDTGYSELGSDSDSGVSYDLKSFPDRTGVQWLFKTQGTKLKIYDPLNVVFNIVQVGLTIGDRKGYEYYDNKIYVLSKVDPHFYLDLTSIARLTAPALLGDTTLNLANSTLLAYFPSSGTVYVNNVAVTYTAKTTTSLTGCSGVVASPNTSLVVLAPVGMTAVDAIVKGNITCIFAGRLWIASGINSTVFASKLLSFTNFAVAGSGVGDAIQLTLESKCNALKVFYDDTNQLRLMPFAANNTIFAVDVDDNSSLSSTIVTKLIFKESVTAQNQFSTVVGYNDLFHVNLDNQIKTLGQTFASQGVNKVYSDNVSQNHKTLFKNNYNFSNSRAVMFNDEYWNICREGNGSINNRVIIFDNLLKVWKKRVNINANDICVYNNQIAWSDASLNKIYVKDNTLSDAGSAIDFIYETADIDTEKMRLERLRAVRIAGFISPNGKATVTLWSDFKTKKLGQFVIDGSNVNILGNYLGKDGSFGGIVFGDQVYGGESGNISYRFFIAHLDLKILPDLENFRAVIEENTIDSYFEMTGIKFFSMPQNEEYFPFKYILSPTQ